MAKRKIGFSLSGGGIRAFAQIGVIKYLHEQGVFATGYSGTSMGSIIATFLACGMDIAEIEQAMLEIEHQVIQHKLFKATNAQFFPLLLSETSGLVKSDKFVDIIDNQLAKCKKTRLKDLRFPIVINAVDLNSGKIVLFTNRKERYKNHTEYLVYDDALIVEALQASCSFPMVFDTMMWRDLQLVDGGVALNAPVLPLKQIGFDHVLSITMGIRSDYHTTKKVMDIANRVVEIIINEADANAIKHAALNINAFDKSIGIFTFGKGKDAIELGYRVAKENHHHIMKFKEESNQSFWNLFK